MSSDPFIAVQGEVTQQLKEVERMQASYLRAAGSSREAAGAALGALLAEVEQDLDDLTGTIAAVAANPARFKISDAEIERRRTFVRSSRQVVASSKAELEWGGGSGGVQSPPAASGGARGARSAEREGLLGGSPSAKRKDGGGGGRQQRAAAATDAALAQHGQQQQQVLRQQDESLDSLQNAVGRLKQMGQTIGDELETQNHMLDGMEGQVDAAANAMSTLKAKMKQLANNKEGGKLCAIAALSATLFVLMYLVVND